MTDSPKEPHLVVEDSDGGRLTFRLLDSLVDVEGAWEMYRKNFGISGERVRVGVGQMAAGDDLSTVPVAWIDYRNVP